MSPRLTKSNSSLQHTKHVVERKKEIEDKCISYRRKKNRERIEQNKTRAQGYHVHQTEQRNIFLVVISE